MAIIRDPHFLKGMQMPLDSEVSDLLKALIVTGAKETASRQGVIGDTLTHGMGVVNTSLIQQTGSVFVSNSVQADDPATMAGLRTATHVPQKDA